MKSTRRRIRTTAALSTSLLLSAVAPAAATAPGGNAPEQARDAAVARSVSWHPTLAIGSGKRKVRFFTCKSGTEGSYTVRYKATTRTSSDRTPPRIKLRITDAGQDSGAGFSLFPGDLSEISSSGLWSSSAEMRVTLRLLGKVKKKQLTVGQMGAC